MLSDRRAAVHDDGGQDAMTAAVVPITSSIGARVEGVTLASVDDAGVDEIRRALHEHGVLVFPEQRLSRDEQVAFTARLGEVHGHPVPEFLFGGADPVAVVENDGDKLPQGDQQFHVDYSFATHIPDLAVLHAEVLPPTGGDTMWTSAAAAYEALSPRMREFVDGLTARHEAGDRFWFEMRRTLGPEPAERAQEHFAGNSHPVVCVHPVTGRRLLFVNPGYTVAINELGARESDGVLRLLFDHLANPAFHVRHRWRDADVVIWDEHLTAHMGPFDFAPHHRRLARVTAGRTAPVGAV
jgi:taurine dioxygenase